MKINGTPKSSALFFWASTEKEGMYFASFFTISPVPIEPPPDETHECCCEEDEPPKFGFPIMVHEPIPCFNIDKIISEARERNASVVDCGRTNQRLLRARMKRAIGDYLHEFIENFIEMNKKMVSFDTQLPISDPAKEKLKTKIRKPSSDDRAQKALEFISDIRKNVKEGNVDAAAELVSRMRDIMPASDDSEQICDALLKKGKISDRIAELAAERLLSGFKPDGEFLHAEQLSSLLMLDRLDSMRGTMKKNISKEESALAAIEDIYRIKLLNPPFCGGGDFNRFAAILAERGRTPSIIAKKYIQKYFAVIMNDFDEAAKLKAEIDAREKEYFEGLEGGR